MPRFAANLGVSPLEPVQAGEGSPFSQDDVTSTGSIVEVCMFKSKQLLILKFSIPKKFCL